MQRNTDWNHYHYHYGEDRSPATVHFHIGSAVFSDADLPHGARVVFAAPHSEDAFLEAVADIEGRLVGRLEYAGKVEFVVALPSPNALEPARTGLERAGATIHQTDGWGYFDSRVCPTPADWRRIQDREAVEALDLDGDGSLRVLHGFVGDSAQLDRVSEWLQTQGFESVRRDAKKMMLAHEHPIDDISRITVGLQRLCDHIGVAYDGWVLPG